MLLRMRFAALSLLLGCICPLNASDAPAEVGDAPTPSIRKELLSEYKFEPPKIVPAQPMPVRDNASISSETPTTTPQDPDLVQMAPYTVREKANMDALHTDIVAQLANARTEAVTRKLGIGMHVAPVGPVGLNAVTAFYIPIQVGFGFLF
jgi:hypothetical protein